MWDMGVGVGERGEGGEEMARGRGGNYDSGRVDEDAPRNGRCWLLWKALRALGFAERRSDWQRSEFEWLKAGGGPSLTGDIYEKPLHFKMNSVMAAPQGSNIGLWKVRGSSSDVQGEDGVFDAP